MFVECYTARMGFQTLLLEKNGAVATLTLNRPEARNALDMTMRRELLGALDEIEADPTTRVLVLTGAGGHFSAGGDVKTMGQSGKAEDGRARVVALNRLVLRLVDFPRPVIGMVDGFAVGAGCNLALCCDLIVASDRAKFGEVFARIGLVPDGGGSWLLPRLVGLPRAKELIFTADIIDAAEAARIGIVNRVVPAAELAATTMTLAERIAQGPPTVLAMAKHMVNQAATSDLARALDLEAFSQAIAISGDAHAEGLRAFFEKRKPNF
jgi:2-(1,2-epoxy-1,2-dihydrophenyl)acetyl-CoA isomerase